MSSFLLGVLVFGCALGAGDGEETAVFSEWRHGDSYMAGEGFRGSVRVADVEEIDEVRCVYAFSDGGREWIACTRDEKDVGRYHFLIPATDVAGDMLSFGVEVVHGAGRTESEGRSVPVVVEKELDITGAAAEVLLYPLGSEATLVRYIPCCNILGGELLAKRLPLNPEGTDAGLPVRLASPFVVLEPDGMTASTSGLFFEFGYDPATLGPGETVAPYTFLGREWRELYSFEVDEKARKVRFHCPDGGSFVLGVRGGEGMKGGLGIRN